MFFLVVDILTTNTCISNNTYGETDSSSLENNMGNETGSNFNSYILIIVPILSLTGPLLIKWYDICGLIYTAYNISGFHNSKYSKDNVKWFPMRNQMI